VRSIVEVLQNGLGLEVSVGYVQGIIAQAEVNARTAFERLLKVIPLSGAICIDEVFFKEMALKVLGVVIVDPLTGLILHLERCTERSAGAIGIVLSHFNAAGFKAQVKLCLTDMYEGYLKPIQTYLPQAVHQFCWFHINCFHIGATVHQAERAYKRAVEAVTAFDKKHRGPLSAADQHCRQALGAARNQAHQHWQGALRFQRLLTRLLWSPSLALATARLDQLIRVAPKVNNAYVQKMGAFLAEHRAGLLVFYACLESGQHWLKRLSRSQQQWVLLTTRWALPLTSNAAEHTLSVSFFECQLQWL
jgi:transposase